ncbi:hypothetical protein QYF36_009329 [Acer negundo]|nr:hypothetical protein QYF36_009329 [Acer negundo]
MSGYSFPPPGYGYGQGQQPTAPPIAQPYAASSAPYSSSPSAPPQHLKPSSAPYAPGGYAPPPPGGSGGYAPPPPGGSGGYAPPPPSGSGGYGAHQHAVPGGYAPAPGNYPQGADPYNSPFSSLLPSVFPPGTDPNIVACFQVADQDGSGFIDDKELQRALSSYNQSFSMRTVHLLMFTFTNTNTRKIGPKEFTSVFHSLQHWRDIFERADRDRSGKIDPNELREALLSVGYSVSPVVLDLLVSKFDKTGGRNRAIEYDNFVECCLTVKGLSEKFKAKDPGYTGSATFTYEAFMLAVLPFLIA